MKIQILSDVHNECSADAFVPARTDADVVVLAGDIDRVDNSFKWANQHFQGKRVVMVAGNHEPWGTEWHSMVRRMRAEAPRYGIDFLENDFVIIDGVKFIGATLFTDMQLFGEDSVRPAIAEARRCMPDFREIRLECKNTWLRRLGITNPFSPQDSIALHKASRGYIERRIRESFDGPVVVVTHHAPSTGSIEERFKEDPLSPCFASNLNDLIHHGDIALWVHGHTHCGFDYSINGTRIVCNAVGYRDRVSPEVAFELSGFSPDFVVHL